MKNLKPFFNPKSILIIGVSRKTYTFSYTLLKNLLEIFYEGNIYIINPNATDILGIKSYHNYDDLPEIPELAVIVLGSNIIENIEKLGKIGVKYISIQSEIQNRIDDRELFYQLNQLSKKYNITYLGPSMIGIMNFKDKFTNSVIPVRPHIMRANKKIDYGLGVIAQSGGLAGALGWWSPFQKIPISKVIHLGRSYDINETDILKYFCKDETIKVISLFLREITDDLIKTVEKITPKKPILIFYVGKEIKKEEELRKAGGIFILNYIELYEIAKLFLWCPEPKGSNLGIIGPSSGAIYVIAKEMRNQNLSIAKLNDDSKNKILNDVGGSTCKFGNPVDFWPPDKFIGTKICGIYNKASHILLRDESVNALILALEFFTEIEFDFKIFKKIKDLYPEKPIITILIHAESEGAKRVIKIATELKIPVFVNEIERSIRGYKLLYDYYSKIKKKK
ncbi:MAG: CoA-binding protein [Candidatus Lokiarchaeota archaeon]|nr:CoA-binding protein [Candidatus Lokiarchaeota archaeon]